MTFSRIIYGARLGRTLWGVEGGDLNRHCVQTHMSIGLPGLRFYFTIAARCFGRWVRFRAYGRRPFIELCAGRMFQGWDVE